jgi:predicted SnoaL-like aldol condensation-catalyzing enzyme
MSKTETPLLISWFEEVWNKGRREAIDEMMGLDCVLHDGSHVTKGADAFREFFDGFQSEFTGIRFTPYEHVADGDLSCLRWSGELKHRASGKDVHITGITMLRSVNGRAEEVWQDWDKLGMTEQLGAPPVQPMHIEVLAKSHSSTGD